MEVYRQVITKMQDEHFLTNRTIRHTRPPRTSDINRLADKMKRHSVFVEILGRSQDAEVKDVLNVGIGMMNKRSAWTVSEEEREDEVDGDFDQPPSEEDLLGDLEDWDISDVLFS